MLKYLKGEHNLRILDIGPTSPTNINFLTSLGHSVYMADLVHDAYEQDWMLPTKDETEEPVWDVDRFVLENLDFAGRRFDVVLLWTTLDYLPDALIEPVLSRFHATMSDGGRVLALFHMRKTGVETAYGRFHLTGGDTIELQGSEPYPIQRVCTNRGIEKLFHEFASCKFFLAKDNLYEVIVTR